MVKLNESIIRASRVLKGLAAAQSSLGLAEISKSVDLPQSTVYRILATLEQEGLIQRDREGNKYRLGVELFRLGSVVLKDLGIEEAADRFMQKLAERSGETINLGILQGMQVLYIHKIESTQPLRADLVVGKLVPAHCTALGKLLLAYLPPAQLDALLEKTALTRTGPNTITDRDHLREEIQCILERGYSIDDEEFGDHIRAIGAPIRNHLGQVVVGLALAAPSSRLTDKRLDQLIPDVQRTADDISRALGYVS